MSGEEQIKQLNFTITHYMVTEDHIAIYTILFLRLKWLYSLVAHMMNTPVKNDSYWTESDGQKLQARIRLDARNCY